MGFREVKKSVPLFGGALFLFNLELLWKRASLFVLWKIVEVYKLCLELCGRVILVIVFVLGFFCFSVETLSPASLIVYERLFLA